MNRPVSRTVIVYARSRSLKGTLYSITEMSGWTSFRGPSISRQTPNACVCSVLVTYFSGVRRGKGMFEQLASWRNARARLSLL